MATRGRILLATVAASLALTGAGCGEATPEAPPSDASVLAARDAESAAGRRVETTEALRRAGVTRSLDEVRIHALVSGTAARVMVRNGDMVKAGDTLVVLANPELSSRADQATALHTGASARAQVAGVDSRMNALDQSTSLSVAELEHEGSRVSADITRHVSTQIVENDQAKNMAFSLADVERSRSGLLRARNRLKQALLQREATAARGASVALSLAKTDRERQRMEELRSKNFASASAAEEAELSHANALSRSEGYKRDLAARDEDVKAAEDEIASAQARLDIWQEALGHGVTSLQGMKSSREAEQTRMGQHVEASGVRLEAARSRVDLEGEKSGFLVAASLEAARDAEAAAQAAGQQVEWLHIVAPADGVVVGLSVAVGELVRSARAGADAGAPLLALADPARLVARVPLSAADLGRVVVGESVNVSATGSEGASIVGDVASVDPATDGSAVYIATIALPEVGDIGIGAVVHVDFP